VADLVLRLQPEIVADQFVWITPMVRGGLVPAALLAYALRLPVLESGDGRCSIVVDDICDTGETLVRIRRRLPRATLVSLVAKPRGLERVPDLIYGRLVPQEYWVVFPWAPHDEVNRGDLEHG